MANSTTGLFETRVIPAAVAAVQALRFTCATTGSIFWDYKTEGGEIGQTMNANIPTVNEGDATDIGSGPISTTDTDQTSVAIVLNQHPSVSFVIRNWDRVRTPADLQRLYVQPKLESLKRRINRIITALATTGNFASYSAITGGADTFTRANMSTAWGNLAGAGVPVYDPGNLFMITQPVCYGNMMADSNFFTESIVGITEAERTLQHAMLAPALNAIVKMDQQFPTVSAGVFAGLFFHRFAIGGVCVDPPSLDQNNTSGDNVQETTVYPFDGAPNFPVQIQMGSSIKDQGTIIHMHAMFGVKVVRADHGSFLQST